MPLLVKLQKLWSTIDQLPSSLKTILIIALFLIINFTGSKRISDISVKHYITETKEEKRKQEEYTRNNAVMINNELTMIMKSNENVTNVMWVSYHNSTESLNGLSYLYLSVISEVQKDISYKSMWKDMDYIHYSEELERIHSRGFLMIDDGRPNDFPRFKKRLDLCDVKHAAFFPINGVSEHIGMIIIFYEDHEYYNIKDFQKDILPHINKLSILLDYDSVKKKRKK